MEFYNVVAYIFVATVVLVLYRWLDSRRESGNVRGRERPGTALAPAPDADAAFNIGADSQARAKIAELESRVAALDRRMTDLDDSVEHRWRKMLARFARMTPGAADPAAAEDPAQGSFPFSGAPKAAPSRVPAFPNGARHLRG